MKTLENFQNDFKKILKIVNPKRQWKTYNIPKNSKKL